MKDENEIICLGQQIKILIKRDNAQATAFQMFNFSDFPVGKYLKQIHNRSVEN